MLYFYQLKLGENVREEFAQQALKNSYLESYYLLPSTVIMQEVRQRFTIRVGNFDTLVKEIIELFSKEIKEPLSSFARELVIKKCVENLYKTGKLEYFAKVYQNNFFITNLASLFAELMSMKIAANDFLLIVDNLTTEEIADKQLSKYQELALIYVAYYEKLFELDERDIYLYYILAERLLNTLDPEELNEGFCPWKNIYISDFYNFNKLELDLIKKLSQFTKVHVAVTYEADREEVFSSLKILVDSLLGIAQVQKVKLNLPQLPKKADLSYLSNNFYNFNFAVPTNTTYPSVAINTFFSKKQEMKFIVERIKKQILAGAKPSEFIIVIRDLGDYPGLLEVFQDVGLTSSLPEVCPVKQHFFMNLIMDIFKLAANKFDKQLFAKVLFSPLLVAVLNYDKDLLEKLFYEQEINSFQELLNKLAEDKVHEKELSAVKKIRALILSLPQQGKIQEYQRFFEKFVLDGGIIKSLGEQYRQGKITLEYFKGSLLSFEFIQRAFQELEQTYSLLMLNNETLKLTVILDYLRQLASRQDLIIAEGDNRGIKIIQAANAQGLNAKNVYILGLNDNVFPKKRIENWLLNPRERSLLAVEDLRGLDKHSYEDSFFFASSLAMAIDSLQLSYVVNDKQAISKYVFELTRLAPNLLSTQQDNFLPKNLETIYSQKSFQEYLVWQLPKFAASETASRWLEEKIGKDLLGIVTNKGIKEGVFLGKTPKLKFSAAQLETYQSCPFKYLAKYVWQEKTWERAEIESSRMLEGSFIHEVLESFVKLYLGKAFSSKAKSNQELIEIFWQKHEKYQAELKVGNLYVWQLKAYLLLRKLQVWFEQEWNLQQKNSAGLLPAYTELVFGEQGLLAEYKFAATVGIIQLNGKIDRLDLGTEQIKIIDYKLGEVPDKKDIELGNSLQLPIYLMAIQDLLASQLNIAKINAGYYTFKSEKYEYNYEINEELVLDTQTQIAAIVSKIHAGDFQPQPLKIRNCSYCDYRNICRYKPMLEDEE